MYAINRKKKNAIQTQKSTGIPPLLEQNFLSPYKAENRLMYWNAAKVKTLPATTSGTSPGLQGEKKKGKGGKA